MQKPVAYISKHNSIFKNLAFERFLYKREKLDRPILYFYQNSKSIIIGRNQNPWKECKLEEIYKREISLCRRFSGGGAVYQDLGNLCFSFITPLEDHTKPPLNIKDENNEILLRGLKRLGINAEAKGRNDLILGDKKFSGSAFEIDLGSNKVTRKVLHHGTLLMNVDLELMSFLLNPNVLKLKSKGIDSVRSRVVNLQEQFEGLKTEDLINSITAEFYDYYGYTNLGIESFSQSDIDTNSNLKEVYDKLIDDDWKLGESPSFSNSFETRFGWGLVDLHLDVKKGRIVDCKLFSDSLFPDLIDSIEHAFREGDVEYRMNSISNLRNSIKTTDTTQKQCVTEFFDWLVEEMQK